ncbi:MAG: tRNA (adenosine(37)-N6)-threonylcarbamoyltransferase complex ATPase subunit type 1 TsaE [Weeksellaceae bacterium]
MNFTANKLEDLIPIAKEILTNLKHKVVLFEGELGAGKTSFIKVLVKEMGSSDEVSSPTFSIVNEYELPKGKVFHFDLYRIKTEEEALDFGIDEYLDSGNFCFIEWPDKISDLLPDDFHTVKIIAEENKRTVIFT